jgi:ankyrin repeat protein
LKRGRKWSGRILLCVSLLSVLAFWVWYNQELRQQYLNHALMEAIKKKNTPAAITLLDQGANANVTDKPAPPRTLITFLADLRNSLKSHKSEKDTNYYPPALLLSYPPELSKLAADRTVLDNPELVQALLEHGANPYTTDAYGDTLLHLAAFKNHIKTVRVLLEHHVDPNVKSIDGITPLMFTNNDCARLLIEYGTDVNARDNDGATPLMWDHSLKTYQLLLDHKADVNAQDHNGQTALIRAVDSYRGFSRIHLLLQHGARVTIKDSKGKTVLDYAGALEDISFHITERQKKDLIRQLEDAARKEQVRQ